MGFTETSLLSRLVPVVPEIFVAIWTVVVLSIDLAFPTLKRRTLGLLAAAGMLGALLLSLLVAPGADQNIPALGGMIRHDLFASTFRIIFYAGAALTCLSSIDFRAQRAGGEYYSLVMFSALAMSLMAASNNIIMLYLATETASIAQYLLAGFLRGNKLSAEAGIKYFVFGAVASTVMLYGLSLIYGMSGSTDYTEIAPKLVDPAMRVPATFALLLVLAGFAFKTSAVPFHFWAPDVYQGAPTPITGFISTASKAAGFAILVRFMYSAFPPGSSLASLSWVSLMQPIAIMTMLVGTLLAVTQKNAKRMLAYSSIAQAGYVLIGVTAFATSADRANALAAVIFYLATYMLANICAFTIVGIVAERAGGDDIKNFAGLARRSPYLALGMVAALLSLLGAPFLVGFIGKLFLFRAALSANLVLLVVVGVFSVLVSVWYYLGIVRAMYVDRGDDELVPLRIPSASAAVVLLSAMGVSLVGLPFISTPFWDMALAAAKGFLLISQIVN